MPALTDILTGFDTVRAEGAASVVDLASSAPFQLVDVERLVVLYRRDGQSIDAKVCTPAQVPESTFFLVWQRRDGAFGAMVPLNVEGRSTTIDATGGLHLRLAGASDRARPAAVFAMAADPFVAADFCRAAAARIAETAGTVHLAADSNISMSAIEPADALYRAAVAAVWSRSVRLIDPPAGAGPEAVFNAAAHALFESSPATIARDRLFVDCREEPRLLKVFGHKGRDGVLGLFHCQRKDSSITDTWRVDDIEGLGGEQFAAWHAIERKLFIINRGVDETVTLPPRGAEIIHLVPILQNVAPLGLIDRLNASAAMTRVGSRKCRLADGGTVGYYAAKRPSQVLLDGTPIEFDYSQPTGLLTFMADGGRPHDSEVIL